MNTDNDSVRAEFQAAFPVPFDAIYNAQLDQYCWDNYPRNTHPFNGKYEAWQASRERYVPSGAVEFARHMLTEVWPEGGIDGGELQDLGERFGLLKPVEVTEPCGSYCACDYYSADFPMTCYKLNLTATPNGGNES